MSDLYPYTVTLCNKWLNIFTGMVTITVSVPRLGCRNFSLKWANNMRYVNGITGFVLMAFAISQLGDTGNIALVLSFAGGSVLALLSLQRSLRLTTARGLAVLSATAMFFYFASFFRYCPEMSTGWYLLDKAPGLIGLLIAGFAMIPVLSVYSCWMKAECHMSDKPTPQKQSHSQTVGHTREHLAP